MDAEARLRELGFELPEVPKLVAEYVLASGSWTGRGMPHFFKNSSRCSKSGPEGWVTMCWRIHLWGLTCDRQEDKMF